MILRTEVGSCSLPAAAHETALVARLREATTLAEVRGGEKGVEEGEREGEITVKQKRMVRASICYSITVLVDVGLLLSLTS